MPVPARACYNGGCKEGVPPEAAGERSLSPVSRKGRAPPGAKRFCALREQNVSFFYKQENAPQEKGECERKMAETILRMTGIQKYFPGVHALDNAQLEVREGEVMALVGENGAGKSTLMKVLTGIYQRWRYD